MPLCGEGKIYIFLESPLRKMSSSGLCSVNFCCFSLMVATKELQTKQGINRRVK
jgi:hypothetical protein